MAICERQRLLLIEDCAHTMDAKWRGRFTGSFGAVGCFSTQTFKHINSGEGGIVVTDDEQMAAKAILYSGSYMLYAQHKSAPPAQIFDRLKQHIPNFSIRMSNLTACLLRVQLKQMQPRSNHWNKLYAALEKRLNLIDGIRVPARPPEEEFVASSIQFHLYGLNGAQMQTFCDNCAARGVAIKWFGRAQPSGYTSQYQHWQYLARQQLPQTTAVLKTTCDMRIPLALSNQDCDAIAAIIGEQRVQARDQCDRR